MENLIKLSQEFGAAEERSRIIIRIMNNKELIRSIDLKTFGELLDIINNNEPNS